MILIVLFEIFINCFNSLEEFYRSFNIDIDNN